MQYEIDQGWDKHFDTFFSFLFRQLSIVWEEANTPT